MSFLCCKNPGTDSDWLHSAVEPVAEAFEIAIFRVTLGCCDFLLSSFHDLCVSFRSNWETDLTHFHMEHFTWRWERQVVKRWSERRSLLSHAYKCKSFSRPLACCVVFIMFICSSECKLPGRRCWRCARRPQTEYPGAAITGRLESVKDLVHQLIYQIGNRSEMEIDLILWKLPARNCPGDCAFSMRDREPCIYKRTPDGIKVLTMHNFICGEQKAFFGAWIANRNVYIYISNRSFLIWEATAAAHQFKLLSFPLF